MTTIGQAAEALRAGKLVAFPTETVYGLGADATNAAAVARVFAVKGRPTFNPLIAHVADASWVAGLAHGDPRFDQLARRFWPGPLALILRRRDDTSVVDLVSAGLDTIAVRAPDHPVALELLNAVQRPIAAPSANRSGRVSPTTAAHVRDSLGDAVDMILDGGPCRVGLESTVLDLSRDMPVILRLGAVTEDAIGAVIGAVQVAVDGAADIRSPGQLASHYAPGLPLRLNAPDARGDEALLGFGPAPGAALNLSRNSDLTEAAANLFAMLRSLDDPHRFKAIAVMPIPEQGIGRAINDRLRRAAAPRPSAAG